MARIESHTAHDTVTDTHRVPSQKEVPSPLLPSPKRQSVVLLERILLDILWPRRARSPREEGWRGLEIFILECEWFCEITGGELLERPDRNRALAPKPDPLGGW